MNRKPTESPEEIEEEVDYVGRAACTVDKTAATSGQKFLSFTQCFATIAACWLTLLVIMSLRIYFTSVMSENIIKLTVENQQLKTQYLTKIQDVETRWNELAHRAQWSIDAYCFTQNKERQCQPCWNGEMYSMSHCYAINNAIPENQKTWEEAQEDCKGKNSDLAVIFKEKEKAFIEQRSWGSSGNKGYWIGLRVECGKWKWVDGGDLAETSWVPPPTDGHCAISVQNTGWKSVSCGDKNRWFCQQRPFLA